MPTVKNQCTVDVGEQTPLARPRTVPDWVIPAVLGLCGIAIVLLGTMRYGAGVSPDSASYISASRSLLAGKGYLYPGGEVYTRWPPLFPTLLAGLSLFGLDAPVGSRILNAIAFGLIVFLSHRLFARCTTDRRLAILGTLSVLVSVPLLGVSSMVWSEPVFIVLVLLFILHMPGFLRTGNLRSLALVSVLAGLACLQRYAGVTAILTGGLLIVSSMPRFSLRRRLGSLAGFGVLSAAPLALWFVHNRVLAGETAGGHNGHVIRLAETWKVLISAGDVVSTWLFPTSFSNAAPWFGPATIFGSMILAIIVGRRRPSEPGDARCLQIWAAAIFGFVYFAFLVLSGAGLSWIPEQRHMSPMYVCFMAPIVVGLEDGSRRLGRLLRNPRRARTVGILLCTAWLVCAGIEMNKTIHRFIRRGPGAYSVPAWQETSLATWLRQHPLQGQIYSNVPDLVYLLTGDGVTSTPNRGADVTAWARRMSGQTGYVVWFNRRIKEYLLHLPELVCRFELEEVASFPDGMVYRVSGVTRPPPWPWGVYRFALRAGGGHFYTIDEREKDRWLGDSARSVYEHVAFCAFKEKWPGTDPVYRFRSRQTNDYFYTIREPEKDRIVRDEPGTWKYEGIAFYACSEKSEERLVPVYGLRRAKSGGHFYTASERERSKLLQSDSDAWVDEGVAWYAYGL
jgi:hypothetical protein